MYSEGHLPSAMDALAGAMIMLLQLNLVTTISYFMYFCVLLTLLMLFYWFSTPRSWQKISNMIKLDLTCCTLGIEHPLIMSISMIVSAASSSHLPLDPHLSGLPSKVLCDRLIRPSPLAIFWNTARVHSIGFKKLLESMFWMSATFLVFLIWAQKKTRRKEHRDQGLRSSC